MTTTTTEMKIVELDEGWEYIEKFIKKLLRKVEGDPDVNITIEDKILVYTKIYDMCTQRPPHDYSKELYDKYKESIREYITSTVLPSLLKKGDGRILRELMERWVIYKNLVKRLSHYFGYLDRYYVIRKHLPHLKEIGLACFRDLVYYEEFKGKVTDTMISLIARQREEKPIDRAVQKWALDAFVELGEMGGTVINEFENVVLKETAAYYSNVATSLMIIRECSSYREYMLKAGECLAKEKNRACLYLRARRQAAFREVVRHEFWFAYVSRHIERDKSRFLAMLRAGNMKELSRIFEPFWKEMIWADPFANIFKQHVYMEAMAIHDAARDGHGQEFFWKVIELHDKCLTYVKKCFQSLDLFHQAMAGVIKRLCDMAVGARPNTELLASLYDDILKGGISKQSCIEERLRKVDKLLPYVSAKVHFVKSYREKLATRILSGRANYHYERKILTNLKWQLGEWYQSQMEMMVEDIPLTEKNQERFQGYIANKSSRRPETDLAVMVLTAGLWQNLKSTDVNLPPEMAKSVEVYEGYYYGLKTNRKLIWIHSVGTCNVIGRFEPKTMELIVTPVQAAVLLLFNSADRLSYSLIKTQLNMTDDVLVGILCSLSCANTKHKILNKVPASGTVSRADYFEFNSKFMNKMTRIKIPPPVIRESKKAIKEVVKDRRYAARESKKAIEEVDKDQRCSIRESEKTIEEVDQDRRYVLDSLIVRIMKRRKVLAHTELVGECAEKLVVTIKIIKERIEALMMRDFLKRDSVDPNLLLYVP